jgi:hypothetical protein
MKTLRATVIVVSLLLATSIGGLGVLAAPLLLPSLWWVAVSGGVVARWISSVASGLLAAEAAMFATVVIVRGDGLSLMGGSIDWSRLWAIPVSVGVATFALYLVTAARWKRRSHDGWSRESKGSDRWTPPAHERAVLA